MADAGNVTENGNADEPRSSLIFLGTGCSSAVPNAFCLIKPADPPCKVCSQSISIPPESNPNYRYIYIYIDCGSLVSNAELQRSVLDGSIVCIICWVIHLADKQCIWTMLEKFMLP